MHTLCIHISAFRDQQFDNFLVTVFSRKMQRSPSRLILRIHIRSFGDDQFGDFLVTSFSRKMQSSISKLIIPRIHIRTSGQVLFDSFDVS